MQDLIRYSTIQDRKYGNILVELDPQFSEDPLGARHIWSISYRLGLSDASLEGVCGKDEWLQSRSFMFQLTK
jgi:hypothetical protein